MTLQKKDFIEIEFTGRIKDTGNIFDSNIKKDLENANLGMETKPFVFCLGEEMFVRGVDEFLVGKDLGEYEIELSPENSFGKRNPQLIQRIPTRIFREHNTNPVQGAMFQFDGKVGKILTLSGGRVIVDFNNPLAGKNVVYSVNVLRKVSDISEKIKALNDFFFRRDFEFEIDGKKLVLYVDKEFKQFAELFADKYKGMLEMELEVKERSKKENSDGKNDEDEKFAKQKNSRTPKKKTGNHNNP